MRMLKCYFDLGLEFLCLLLFKQLDLCLFFVCFLSPIVGHSEEKVKYNLCKIDNFGHAWATGPSQVLGGTTGAPPGWWSPVGQWSLGDLGGGRCQHFCMQHGANFRRGHKRFPSPPTSQSTCCQGAHQCFWGRGACAPPHVPSYTLPMWSCIIIV